MSTDPSGPLQGIRVVEIGSIGPGPFAAMLFADMGADVLRVDRSDGRDVPGAGAWNPLQRNRRSVGIDLKHPEGGESIEERLDEEEPEVWEQAEDEAQDGPDDIRDGDVGGEVGGERSGRLMAPDEGAHEDTESALVAEDEGIDGAGASAEEAAMHVVDE